MKKNLHIPLILLFIGGCEKKNGLETHFYSNGNKKYEVSYKNGEKNGLETYWELDGKKKQEVTYKNGKKDGLETYWWVDGQKSYLATAINNNNVNLRGKVSKENIIRTPYEKNGSRYRETTYKDGKINGLETYFYDNGNKKYEITYKDGKINGLYTEYHYYGYKLFEYPIKNGKVDGSYIEFEKNGDTAGVALYKEGNYVRPPSSNSYNVSGSSSSPISKCKTCGTSYKTSVLPYGKYCSKRCCAAYEGPTSECGY
tara:strand:+ start:34 stop:801 length:768 start_codon:yes stop_codon:yes gene_type:complete